MGKTGADTSVRLVGVDVGGTFTDLIYLDPAVPGGLRLAKVPSTPENQAIGVLAALKAAGADPATIDQIIHGTTTTTNSLLERKIARTGMITTKGFRDLLELGRRTRPTSYGLTGAFEPLIPRELRYEVAERVDADGVVLTPLDEGEVRAAAVALKAAGCESVVVHFLHSYANQTHEQRATAILEQVWPEATITAGSAILSEFREYERGTTAAVNAAVQPVLRRYLERLTGGLAERGYHRELLVMQGNGGTVTAAMAARHAVNTVMSGPASGVIAAAYTASATGISHAITYDMGGTSSDVGLILDGLPNIHAELDLEYGMPIHVPMVDVHTIGAGGGSIARIDEAGLLRVGPESAGAVPGPICYGRGGTAPTITDANLVLGRLDPNALLAVDTPVTVAQVAARIEEEIGRPLGLDAIEAAAAILRVGNDKMAGAVRMMSLARGYDPRDFALFAFGGAGPLHATALARELAVPTVVIPARPGITNAVGCVVADLRHDFVNTLNTPLSTLDIAEVHRLFAEQEAEGRATLDRAAVDIARVEVRRSVDMQFLGQSHILQVPLDTSTPALDVLESRFAAAYWERFAVDLPEIRPVLVNLHTAVLGIRPPVPLARLAGTEARAATVEAAIESIRPVWFETTGFIDTPVYRRDRLPELAAFQGPAIIAQFDATTVIEPGQTVRLDSHGNLLITAQGKPSTGATSRSSPPVSAPATLDPVTLAVIQNGLQQVCNEMDVAFSRAAFSPVISETYDRSDGIYHRDDGALIAQGEDGLPVFVGTMQDCTAAVIERAHAIAPGDVFIVNDPYLGGTHLMDVKFVKPFFYKGALFCWLANTGHWPDIGGAVPGGFSASATESEQEGLRLPPVKLYKKGKLDQEILSIILSNIRIADQRIGDIKAQAAALTVGERRLTQMLDRYGDGVVDAAIVELRARAAQQMRAKIRQIPDGTYESTAIVDSDGVVDAPLTIALTMTKAGNGLHFDFARSSPPCQGPMNSVIATTKSSVYLAMKHIYPDIPINAGTFEPLHVAEPDGTFLYAHYPRPVSGCAAEVSQRIAEAVFAAMTQAMPDILFAAPAGTSGNFSLGGLDPKTGRSFVCYLISGGGYGGHVGGDGLTNGCSTIGISKTTPIEVVEQRYPILYEEYALREGSGGAGRHRGGFGVRYKVRLRRGEARASFVMDHGRVGPQGALGGADGAPNTVLVERGGESYTPVHLSKEQGIPITAGDAITVETPGGGGYGNPAERDPALCVRDIKRGYYTTGQVKERWGVDLAD